MKKIIFSILVLTLATVACSTSDFLPTVIPPTPTVDIKHINDALTQTQTTLATPTIVPVTETFTSTIASPKATATDTSTSTPVPNLTATPATSTSAPVGSISTTPTLITSQAGTPTLTPTLGVLTYGTLPPAVPFSKVTLINKSRAQAYISLQNYPANGNATILEYPVGKRVEVKAPLGNYIYVAWVGGKKMTGSFVLNSGNDITITIYKDKVITQ